jgi:hypothetical protein
MPAFDPNKIRKAVEEFTPRRPQKFQELFAAKDVIVELRQKRASYRSIADLLTRHCLPTCKTSVALFCHKILGEATRTRGRPAREQLSESETPAYEAPVIAPLPTETGTSTQPNGGDWLVVALNQENVTIKRLRACYLPQGRCAPRRQTARRSRCTRTSASRRND